MSEIVVSICSRVKSTKTGFMPAQERYAGTHIAKVREEAERRHARFYILSGKHGLIMGKKRIENYDYLLTSEGIDELVPKIVGPLRASRATEVHFFTKMKESWEPYLAAMERAVKVVSVRLILHRLGQDD